MITFQIKNEEYGWIIYRSLNEAVEAIREELDAESLTPGDVEITVRIKEMTEEEVEALPEV